jgi:hypothetical protein
MGSEKENGRESFSVEQKRRFSLLTEIFGGTTVRVRHG